MRWLSNSQGTTCNSAVVWLLQSNQTAELSEFLELVILRASNFRQKDVDKTMQSLRRFLLKNLSNKHKTKILLFFTSL
ncbi:hypothetical protein LIL_20207 [Leptospira interrogans serovar Linhai str. 56609]|nr:hypothetical protein LIL_20207 [Leptospira interrogans serovar Linhai str. 56609]MTY92029.1 hypothetical protein [Leptospira interrogans serovar Copenhageni]NUL40936.1 hypothetical protein [Leptospira interrogans serovar Copenhageni]QHH34044.1 hypothetical protein GS525_18620 [Leptospira interrogans]